MTTALLHHAALALRLNFRSRQAIVYGYLVPLFFLLAFGSVFRASEPPLLGQMGQLLTITILGGACFGLPTGLVAERERGVWRHFRLTPVPLPALLAGTLAARVVIVALAAAMQVALAHWIYGTPWPAHSWQLAAAFLLVCAAFLGLGLVVAALARDVPAVQAIGQCLFLPMIMIGGVGVPLVVLPEWAQRLACFMPGRYAVEVLQPCFNHPYGLRHAGLSLLMLVVIGAAAALAGGRLFQWDTGQRLRPRDFGWVGAAFAGWMVAGGVAVSAGHIGPVTLVGDAAFADIDDAAVSRITFEDLPPDDGIYAPLAPAHSTRRLTPRIQELIRHLDTWAPARTDDIGQNVRNLLCVAAIADIGQELSEADIARAVFERLRVQFDEDQLRRALAWVVLQPGAGTVVIAAPELGLRGEMSPAIVRERSTWYAKKFLGRLVGTIPDTPPDPD
ncbi:MAG: ABC transporter permease [Opitutaceae bacterium]|nr:ABC transporter permease [Opitutaceae bacterium]